MFNMKKKKHNCPSDEIVACYVDGILPDSEKAAVDDHMLSCSSCRENITIQKEVVKLQQLQGLDFAPSYLTERAKGLVAESAAGKGILELIIDFSEQMFEAIRTTGEVLVGPSRPPVFSLRAGSANVSKVLFVKKVFDDIRVEVELMRSRDDLNTVNLTFKDDKTEKLVVDLRATLINDDIELESYVTQNGKVAFENIKQGKYKIDISKVDSFVGVIVLELNKK